jgi:hypothetical protein
MRKSLTHFETIPVALVRKIAKPLPPRTRSGSQLIAARRLHLAVKPRVQASLIPRKGN